MKSKILINATLSILIIISLIIQSCGTIFTGTSDDVNINSTPPKANVKVVSSSGLEVFNGFTPCTVNLSKKHDYNVIIKLEGYLEQKVFINSKLNAFMVVLDVLCSGLTGIIIDVVTGGWNKLEPTNINVTLLTAYNENGEQILYTVFSGYDDEGNPREYKIPLIKK